VSPGVVHRQVVDAKEVPPTRQTFGACSHAFAQLATNPISYHCRANSLWSRKGHAHSAGGVIKHYSHTESLVSNRTGARKTGETNPSRNTADHADKRARPLERRDFSTARPALVFIRLRNPCFFARRRLLG